MSEHGGGWPLEGAPPWGSSAGEPEHQRAYLWRGRPGLLALNAAIVERRREADAVPHGRKGPRSAGGAPAERRRNEVIEES